MREEEERPLKNLQAASGDPGISPSHRADHLRLRDSSVGSPEKSDATGQTAGMHVSLKLTTTSDHFNLARFTR